MNRACRKYSHLWRVGHEQHWHSQSNSNYRDDGWTGCRPPVGHRATVQTRQRSAHWRTLRARANQDSWRTCVPRDFRPVRWKFICGSRCGDVHEKPARLQCPAWSNIPGEDRWDWVSGMSGCPGGWAPHSARCDIKAGDRGISRKSHRAKHNTCPASPTYGSCLRSPCRHSVHRAVLLGD